MYMMMSITHWFLPLTLFIFVDGQIADCDDDDSIPLRIVVQPCDKFPAGDAGKITWEVKGIGGTIKKGEFEKASTFEDTSCLVPTGCYVVDLESYYGDEILLDGGSYSIFYDETLISTGGSFSNKRSNSFGNGCTVTPSMSPTQTQIPTTSMSPTATLTPSMSPTATFTPSMSPTATFKPSMSPTQTQIPTAIDSMLPTATRSMSPSATPKVTEAPNASSVRSSDYTAVTITIVVASLAVLCVGGW